MRKLKLRLEIAQLVAQSQEDGIVEVSRVLIRHPRFEQDLAQSGAHVMIIDRAVVYDKPTLLHALYQACQFPAYFGFNWDALLDCLSDFGWHAAKSHVLIMRDPSVIKERNREDWETFCSIVRSAIARRSMGGLSPLRLYIGI
jgi:hypothetical protein